MSFNLSEFLTEGLITSIDNGLIQPELATVYAGNYLAKSLITQTQVAQVSDALTTYKAELDEETVQSEAPVEDTPPEE